MAKSAFLKSIAAHSFISIWVIAFWQLGAAKTDTEFNKNMLDKMKAGVSRIKIQFNNKQVKFV